LRGIKKPPGGGLCLPFPQPWLCPIGPHWAGCGTFKSVKGCRTGHRAKSLAVSLDSSLLYSVNITLSHPLVQCQGLALPSVMPFQLSRRDRSPENQPSPSRSVQPRCRIRRWFDTRFSFRLHSKKETQPAYPAYQQFVDQHYGDERTDTDYQVL
jgi:hypothetical protein